MRELGSNLYGIFQRVNNVHCQVSVARNSFGRFDCECGRVPCACYWGVEAIFDRLKSISGVESGFAKGDNSGDAGHAESVKISYDPSKISCGQLLEIFFAVAHDPTELNRQGPDVGAEYRSVIFYSKDDRSMSPKRISNSSTRPVCTRGRL